MTTATASQSYDDLTVGQLIAEYRRTGNSRLRDQAVEQMRPLVKSVARKFAGKEPLEDLESEGLIGLIRAVDRFSPEKGARFSTFAMHLVAGQIRHYLRDRGHMIRQPAWLQELNTRVQKLSRDLEQKLHREPTVAELAKAANITEEAVEELIAARQVSQTLRLASPSDGDDDDFLDVDPDKFKSRSYTTLELPVEDRIVLETALEKLKELEKKAVYYFFYKDFTQSEIARTLDISCNYAGYVLRNGIKHLKERVPVENAWMRDKAPLQERDSVVDSTTGVYKREHFERRLNEEVRRSQCHGAELGLVLFSLPENCNEGDLHEAAVTLRAKVRKADVVGRVGHRMLAVIFTRTGDATLQVGRRLAEMLSPAVPGVIETTAATYPADARSGTELLQAVMDPRDVLMPILPTREALALA
jgi:RNA polymerase sigma-B factor